MKIVATELVVNKNNFEWFPKDYVHSEYTEHAQV